MKEGGGSNPDVKTNKKYDLTPLTADCEIDSDSLKGLVSHKHSCIQRFFDRYLAPFVYKHRRCIICVSLLWLLITILLTF